MMITNKLMVENPSVLQKGSNNLICCIRRPIIYNEQFPFAITLCLYGRNRFTDIFSAIICRHNNQYFFCRPVYFHRSPHLPVTFSELPGQFLHPGIPFPPFPNKTSVIKYDSNANPLIFPLNSTKKRHLSEKVPFSCLFNFHSRKYVRRSCPKRFRWWDKLRNVPHLPAGHMGRR